MWYLIGLGSNIAPQLHLPRALCALADEFGAVWVSLVGVTEPVGMSTDRQFLNCVVALWAPLEAEALKQRLNTIEIGLGRDRNDPDRALKDRTIDLDILDQARTPLDFHQPLEESYYREVLEATRAAEPPADFRNIRLEIGGVALGQAPATVYRNGGTGHKVVVDQRQ